MECLEAGKKPGVSLFSGAVEGADWCGPCKLIAPLLDEVASEMEGKLAIGKLDVDANSKTAMKFGVMSIPTMIIFKNGTEVKRMVGYQDKATLVKNINEAVSG